MQQFFSAHFISNLKALTVLASSTRLLGFTSNVISCIAVYTISVPFVLFLLVMCIWIDLQVLKIWDFGSTFKSRRVKPNHEKPTAWEASKDVPSHHWLGEDVGSG
jgi:hypothetical protein